MVLINKRKRSDGGDWVAEEMVRRDRGLLCDPTMGRDSTKPLSAATLSDGFESAKIVEPSTKQQTTLQSLPAELRDQIIKYTVISDEPILIAPFLDISPLLRVNKQFRSESIAYFYERNTFEFRLDTNINQFIHEIGSRNLLHYGSTLVCKMLTAIPSNRPALDIVKINFRIQYVRTESRATIIKKSFAVSNKHSEAAQSDRNQGIIANIEDDLELRCFRDLPSNSLVEAVEEVQDIIRRRRVFWGRPDQDQCRARECSVYTRARYSASQGAAQDDEE